MKSIITVGRQFGTGGHEIGQMLAEKLGVKCYDKELIKRVAKESGLCEEILDHNDERPTSSFLYNLVMDTYSFGITNSSYVDMPLSHKVFLAQFDTIKKIADEGPCVIVGRCADYALADYDNAKQASLAFKPRILGVHLSGAGPQAAGLNVRLRPLTPWRELMQL